MTTAELRALLDEALGAAALDRAGWVQRGLGRPESVAAHAWGVAWLALVLCPATLDRARVLAFAVLHDLPEVRVGDLTPRDGVSREDKARIEDAAAADLLGGRPDLLALWRDYTAQRCPESRFVHALDRQDMGLQAAHYARTDGLDPTEFIDSALRGLADPSLRALLDG